MPIYIYEAKEGCKACGGSFEVLQSIHDAPLASCPTCGKSCKRIIGAFSCGKGLLGFNLTQAKQSGLQVLKRRDKGVYEQL